MDIGTLEQAIYRLTTPDTNVIREAEAYIKKVLSGKDSITALIQLLGHSQHASVRQLSAMFLRVRINTFWMKFPPGEQNQIKDAILQCLSKETERLVRFNTAHVVARLSKHQLQLGANGWPELFAFLEQSSTSSTPDHRELGMTLFFVLTESVALHMKGHLPQLAQLYGSTLADSSNPRVRVAALKATGALMEYLSESEEVMYFEALIPSMMDALEGCVASGDDDVSIQIIEVITELADCPTPLLNQSVSRVLKTLMEIVLNRDVSLATRDAAIICVDLVVAHKSKLVVKAGLAPNLVQACMTLCAEDAEDALENLIERIQNSETETSAEDEDEQDEVCIHFITTQLVDAVTQYLPSKLVFRPLIGMCMALLNESGSLPEKERTIRKMAGLIGLTLSAEHLVDTYIEVEAQALPTILPVVLACASDVSNPAIQQAACNCLVGFSIDLQPEIMRYHTSILPALLPLLDLNTQSGQQPVLRGKIISNALDVFESLCDHLSDDEIVPYVEPLCSRLLTLLATDDSVIILERSLATLSSVMVSAPVRFVGQFFSDTLKIASHFMTSITEESRFRIRGRATEMIGHLSIAVAEHKEKTNTVEYYNTLLELLRTSLMHFALQQLKFDSFELHEYTYGLFSNLAVGLHEDVDPFLETMIPALIEACENEEGISDQLIDPDGSVLPQEGILGELQNQVQENERELIDNDSIAQLSSHNSSHDAGAENDQDGEGEEGEFLPLVRTKMDVRTAAVESKTASLIALTRIAEFASVSAIFPHFQSLLPILSDLVTFVHRRVREHAIECATAMALVLHRGMPFPSLQGELLQRALQMAASIHRELEQDRKWLPGLPALVKVNPQLREALDSYLIPILLRAIGIDGHKSVVRAAVEAFENLAAVLGPESVPNHLDHVMKALHVLLRKKAQCQWADRGASGAENGGGGEDDNDEEDDQDHQNSSSGAQADKFLLDRVADTIGTLAFAYGPDFASFAMKSVVTLVKYTKLTRKERDRTLATGCFCELIFAIGFPANQDIVTKVLPVVLANSAKDPSLGVRRNYAYLSSALVEAGHIRDIQVIMQLTQNLQISVKNIPAEEWENPDSNAAALCDNTAGFIARVLLSGAIPDDGILSLLQMLLELLPIKDDQTENYAVWDAINALCMEKRVIIQPLIPAIVRILSLPQTKEINGISRNAIENVIRIIS